VGQIDTGVGILESSVFLPNDLADIFDGESVWEQGRVGLEGVASFSYTVIVVGEG
jgi:hypothetical protein